MVIVKKSQNKPINKIQKLAEMMCPLTLNSEDILDHLNMPFAGDRKATALRLVDLALILEEFRHQENKDQLILDIGVGGGWTTEWFNRSGLNPISIDISSNWYIL